MTQQESTKIYSRLKKVWKAAKQDCVNFASLLSNDTITFEYYGVSESEAQDQYVYYFVSSGNNPFDFKMLVENNEIKQVVFVDDVEREKYNDFLEASMVVQSKGLHTLPLPALYLSLGSGAMFYDTNWISHKTGHLLTFDVEHAFLFANCIYQYFFKENAKNIKFIKETRKAYITYTVHSEKSILYPVA